MVRPPSLWPRDYSARSLRKHARALAGVIHINPDGAAILTNEIRNALCPVSAMIDAARDEGWSPEDTAPADDSMRRVLALLMALDDRRIASRGAHGRRRSRSLEPSSGSGKA